MSNHTVFAATLALLLPAIASATLGRFTRFAGKAGLGMEYNLPPGLGLFVQGASYIYKFDRGGFNKTQADLQWTGGLSYRYRL